jgi:hypothetical protein
LPRCSGRHGGHEERAELVLIESLRAGGDEEEDEEEKEKPSSTGLERWKRRVSLGDNLVIRHGWPRLGVFIGCTFGRL